MRVCFGEKEDREAARAQYIQLNTKKKKSSERIMHEEDEREEEKIESLAKAGSFHHFFPQCKNN